MEYFEKEKIYEGKAKCLYSTEDPSLLIQFFKDDLTAFNGERKERALGKGAINNAISAHIFTSVISNSVPHHFVQKLDQDRQLIRKVEIIPLEVVVRNIASGSIVKRLGIERGREFKEPLFEIFYKNDQLQDPIIRNEHAVALGIATENQIESIKKAALKVNLLLREFFLKFGLVLVDFKIEFGINEKGVITLADEISPDSCRLWDVKTKESLDKDVFRNNTGSVIDAYKKLAYRIGINSAEWERKV